MPFPTNKSDEWIGKGSLKRGKGLIDLKKAFYEFPYKQYPFRFDKYFASKVTNEIVVTSLETGKAEFLTEKSDEKRLLDIGAASSSLPIISKAVKIDGKNIMMVVFPTLYHMKELWNLDIRKSL